jgi:hypothetical protein
VRADRSLRAGDHSSSSAITGGIKRPTRRLYGRAVRCDRSRWPPYLVLLRAGFGLPPVLPRARCALTAPFHPFSGRPEGRPLPISVAACLEAGRRGIFSVPLSFELPRPGVTRRTALRSSDFPPLDSALRTSLRAGPAPFTGLVLSEARRAESKDDRLAYCDGFILLPVSFLRNLVLFQLLVQVAARRVDHFCGLRNIPPVLAQFAHQVRALGDVLEFPERARLRRLIVA